MVAIAWLFLCLLGRACVRVATCPIPWKMEILVSPLANSELIHMRCKCKAGRSVGLEGTGVLAVSQELNAFTLQWMHYLPSDLKTMVFSGRFSVRTLGSRALLFRLSWKGAQP